jgi:hypothetical protein
MHNSSHAIKLISSLSPSPFIIRRHTDNMGLLLINILLLPHSFIFNVYMVVFPFNAVINVFLLLCLIVRLCLCCIIMYLLYVYIFIVCLWVPSVTLTEVFPCFFPQL